MPQWLCSLRLVEPNPAAARRQSAPKCLFVHLSMTGHGFNVMFSWSTWSQPARGCSVVICWSSVKHIARQRAYKKSARTFRTPCMYIYIYIYYITIQYHYYYRLVRKLSNVEAENCSKLSLFTVLNSYQKQDIIKMKKLTCSWVNSSSDIPWFIVPENYFQCILNA